MSDLFTNRDIFQLLLSSFSRFSAFLLLPPRLTRCPFVSEASLPPPLMNQRSAHPEWREPINRCENGRIVENCIRTTDIFCQFPQRWRHTTAQPLGSRRLGRDIPYASSPKKGVGPFWTENAPQTLDFPDLSLQTGKEAERMRRNYLPNMRRDIIHY